MAFLLNQIETLRAVRIRNRVAMRVAPHLRTRQACVGWLRLSILSDNCRSPVEQGESEINRLPDLAVRGQG
jgi:hypothetical protein